MQLSNVVAGPRPFVSNAQVCKRSVAAAARRPGVAPSIARQQKQAQLRTRSAEPEPESEAVAVEEEERSSFRGRRNTEDKPQFKHFLPLPKPAHLVYIKPTVAVVADMAPRSSVGVKMTAGSNALERFVVEYYARSVK